MFGFLFLLPELKFAGLFGCRKGAAALLAFSFAFLSSGGERLLRAGARACGERAGDLALAALGVGRDGARRRLFNGR